jgi:hypothetical protein
MADADRTIARDATVLLEEIQVLALPERSCFYGS